MIKFGTSGFRAVIGENFTKESVQRVAYAVSMLIKKEKVENPVVDIGFDNRFMAEIYAKWVAEVLAYNKIKVNFFSLSTPTPTIAYMSKKHTFGIVLTASHNPFYYNGMKVIKESGEVNDKYASKIEKIANGVVYEKIKTLSFDDGVKQGLIKLTTNTNAYQKSILSYLDKEKLLTYNPKVLFNAMHGNSSRVVREICKKLGFTNYEIMKENIDPYFEGGLPAPYLKNVVDQKEKVVNEHFDIGLAFDGDSDRLTIIDKNGEIYDCNYVLPVVFDYFVKVKGYKGGVAHNGAFSSLISLVAKDLNEKEVITKVGFKNVAEAFKTTTAFMGGETNGIALKEHIYGKDGIMAGFFVLEILCHYQKSFKEILEETTRKFNFPSCVIEFAYPITMEKKAEINEQVFVKKELPSLKEKIVSTSYFDGLKMNFKNNYWAAIRFSGNENVVRIFTEMKDLESSNKMVAKLEKFIGVKVRQ